MPRPPMSPETKAKIAAARRAKIDEAHLRQLHQQGLSCREMAPLLGATEEPVRRAMKRLGLPRLAAKARPDRNAFWRGGYTVDEEGYILQKMSEHPQADRHGYVRVHRLVMERTLGRPLTRAEVVDHRNGDTSDNRPENLRVFPTNADHLRATLTGQPKLSAVERERLRLDAVRRGRERVAAILAASGTGADQSP